MAFEHSWANVSSVPLKRISFIHDFQEKLKRRFIQVLNILCITGHTSLVYKHVMHVILLVIVLKVEEI